MKTLLAIAFTLAACSSHTDHASEFMLDINSSATCSYWGVDKDGNDTALCKVQTYLVRCVAGPNTDKPACNAIVNLAPPPAPAPAPTPAAPAAPATGSGSGK